MVFTGARAEYLVTPDGSGGFIVADNGASGDGTDHLLHVTKLQFADGTVDAASTASGAALTGTSTA